MGYTIVSMDEKPTLNPHPLTPKQIKSIKVRYANGASCRTLCDEYGVKHSWLYARISDIRKNKRQGEIDIKPRGRVSRKRDIVDDQWTIKEMMSKSPHVLLHLFAVGELDDDQIDVLQATKKNNAYNINQLAVGKSLEEIVRDYPLLLLRTCVRIERHSGKRRCPVTIGRQVSASVNPDPLTEIIEKEFDMFDPDSDTMQSIAKYALYYAIK